HQRAFVPGVRGEIETVHWELHPLARMVSVPHCASPARIDFPSAFSDPFLVVFSAAFSVSALYHRRPRPEKPVIAASGFKSGVLRFWIFWVCAAMSRVLGTIPCCFSVTPIFIRVTMASF